MTVPLQIKNYGQSYFLRLDTTEMDQVYSPGTILEVVDLKNFTRDLRHGNRVIVTRTTPEGFVETGCREIVQDGETSQIVTRSSDARFRERMMPIPWPIIPERQIETPNGNVIEIRGVVVRSLRDEIDG